MRKISALLLSLLFLSGCATYKIQKGQSPYDSGYVAAKDGRTILEYTVGKDNSVSPDLETAQERFNRRKMTVEQYYEKMGYMKSRLKQTFGEPPVMLAKFIGGFFRLPFIAVSNYKYNHDPKYKENIDRLEQERAEAERKRISALKEELNAYVQKDIETEPPRPVVVEAPPKAEEKPATQVEAEQKSEAGQEMEAALQQEEKQKEPFFRRIFKKSKAKQMQAKEVRQQPLAGNPAVVIVAKPQKGYSPLKVHFSGTKSRSPNGKIIAYEWDFGDDDKSTKPNPINTYYSSSFEPRRFSATLTVTDAKGGSATGSIDIEVLNK